LATISVVFKNDYSDSRKWTIWDVGIDPSSPKILFDDYLDKDASTQPLAFHQEDGGVHGYARYKRSDGPATDLTVSDGDIVSMT
jgi:hypothetical protein